MRLSTSLRSALLAASLVTAAYPTLSGAVFTYTNNFNGSGANTDLPNEATGTWAVSGGTYNFSSSSTVVSVATATIDITGIGTSDFVMESTFVLDSGGDANSNGITIGFGLFGATPGFGGSSPSGSSAFYLADWQVSNDPTGTGLLRILSLGNSADFTAISSPLIDDNPGSTELAAVEDKPYTLRLTGTYTGSTLNMSLALFDALSGNQIGSSATAFDTTPLTGQYFGYRNRFGLGGGTLSVAYDTLAIVPEPGTLGTLALGLAGALMLRRRRSV